MLAKHEQELAFPVGSKVLMAGLLTLAVPLAMGRFAQARAAQRALWLASALILAAGVVATRSAVAIVILPFAVALPSVLGNQKRGRLANPD